MELVVVIRHKVLTEGVPIRDVARQLGLSRNTIRRYVRAKVVPVPRCRRAHVLRRRESRWLRQQPRSGQHVVPSPPASSA